MIDYITEQRVLQITQCQGYFKLPLNTDATEGKGKVVSNLYSKGYLRLLNIKGNTATYETTSLGKEYLKKLVSKHSMCSKSQKKALELEIVLNKRLNLLRNANKRGLEFNLTDSNVKKLLNSKTCYYTGVEFDEDNSSLNARTFERVNDSKGYVNGNVVAITLRANRIKNQILEQNNELKINVSQFIMMADKLREHLV